MFLDLQLERKLMANTHFFNCNEHDSHIASAAIVELSINNRIIFMILSLHTLYFVQFFNVIIFAFLRSYLAIQNIQFINYSTAHQ